MKNTKANIAKGTQIQFINDVHITNNLDETDGVTVTSDNNVAKVTVKQVSNTYTTIYVKLPDGKTISIDAHGNDGIDGYKSSSIAIHHRNGKAQQAKITKKKDSVGSTVWTDVFADGEEIVTIFN